MTKLLVYSFLSIPLIGAYMMFAIGIVVIYRSSRVLNLAHGAMAMAPAYVYYSLTKAHLPALIALLLAVAAGAGLGVLVEFAFVRRLRPQGATAQTVGTVAVTGLLIALVGRLYGTSAIQPKPIFPAGQLKLGPAIVRFTDLGILLVGLAVAAAVLAFFKFTQFGLAMRGAAQNRTAATLMGINPQVAASSAWALGGGLAALAGVLLAAATNLNPYTLSLEVLPAFVAALLGGLEALGGALIGAVVAGLAFGLVPLLAKWPIIGPVLRLSGASQLMLTVLTLVVLALRGNRMSAADRDDGGLGTSAAASVAGYRKRSLRPSAVVVFVLLLIWPFVAPFSALGSSLLALEYAVIAFSLVILTGWVGQISLAQATFVGVGALVTAMVARGTGLGFPLDVVVGALAAGVAAVALGAVALRVRGLYLAVATLIFAWMGDAFLFTSPVLGLGEGSSTLPNQRIGREGGYISLDLTSRRVLFIVFLAIVVTTAVCLSNLRDARTGRALSAIRGSEVAAASLGIDVVRYKLVAFAVSGVLAGLGGGMLVVEQRTVVPSQFFYTVSLQFLAIAVVGGLASLGGAVAAGILFAGLSELFFRVNALSGWLDVVSALLLAGVLLLYPTGLAGLLARAGRVFQQVADEADRALAPAKQAAAARWAKVRESLPKRRAAAAGVPDSEDWMAARLNAEVPEVSDEAAAEAVLAEAASAVAEAAAPPQAVRTYRRERDYAAPIRLEARDVTVRFGGLTAVDTASLEVREAEVVGLIGPNGAGKTTLFNAILGLNEPQAGHVYLYGNDATKAKAHVRATMGVARTFQVLQLFRGLTVFDNLLVATHQHNASTPLGNLVASATTVRDEHACRERVREVLRLLGLEDVADQQVSGLPFGILRLVELGRALVTGANLLLLDEAASGLNDHETDRLIDVIGMVRELGVSVLLIEHDIRMVNAACDYVYVLDRGRMISEGTPGEISADPAVLAAYLGTTTADDGAAPDTELVGT
ncbi:MAG TPA: ATP-binding cassette domain-containing protein [Mycobacteriales bacterium]|jgi:sulfate-transporting ATPase|nr:ATP-binding cassette domain-containing protein [Mycobacteriales bacterium]